MAGGIDKDLRSDEGLIGVLYKDQPLLEAMGKVITALEPEFPERISQPRWDQGRLEAGQAVGHPNLPTASAIYQRLNRGRDGRQRAKLPWARIVELSLRDG